MKISVMRFGVIEGIKKGLKRLWRCQPFFQCGCDSYGDYIDLVPEKVEIQINIKSKD